ncbi:MAG: AAA family ATPase [Desulfosarcina sp.]|nr:AAA family ATPase [Desulfosarcina sp.]MBC2742850.1 AAA family ATPase [Desulfosarcina sp.]MBC2765760.1 AAA family ATPase [Desulfosarcina sp.]
MIVTSLKIANLRAIETATFHFKPGMNLIVGVNGVGKTSIIDALSVCLSAVVKHSNRLRTRSESFTKDDIRIGTDVLSVECGIEIHGGKFEYLVHKPRETSVAQSKKTGMPREQVHDTPKKAKFLGNAPQSSTGDEVDGRPLAVLFSTRRALPSERTPSKTVAAGGVTAACADAFANRELRLGEFSAWMRVQDAIKTERSQAKRVLKALEDAVQRFLPGYSNLHISNKENGFNLLINRGQTEINVRQLSDGERGVLALVLDLTRRLANANPAMDSPTEDAEAVVLIDEIDLHLHPKWQRQITRNLIAAFPKCQFIATTHSPQVIGEVENERIQIIADGQVNSPGHSFGVDSSRVLEEIMDARPRAREVHELLTKLSRASSMKNFKQARNFLDKLAAQVGEDDPEVTRARTLLEFLEDDE